MRIHDYFKFLKFGCDRVTDWCCWHIREKVNQGRGIKIDKQKSGNF